MQEKMTITWNRYVCNARPATEEDVEEYGVAVGEMIDVEEEVELPGKYAVCGRCQGKGSHVNPSIDGHGITMEEWWGPDWDDESREDYMNGAYDVACHSCGGKRVVLVVDEERCNKELLEEYNEAMDERAREDYCDRRMRWAEDGYRGSFDDY